MTLATRQRLFDLTQAFDSGVVRGVLVAMMAILVLAPILILWMRGRGMIQRAAYEELMKRYKSWLVLAPLMIVPILLGAFWTIIGVGTLSLLCYREYARATGLFRERLISLLVVIGILAVTFAVLDHWYGLFAALFPLTAGGIAAIAIFADRPEGYIQRVALAVLAFALFGVCFGNLGYFANDSNFRPILFWLIVCVELNDVFAYVSGKTFGHRRLTPRTSPNKTVGRARRFGAYRYPRLSGLGHFAFRHSPVDRPFRLVMLGVVVSVCGQHGDLLISSIKRDLAIKDMGALFPGHGGWLDRFDSLILVAPAVFHFVGYYCGIGLDQQSRIFSGG